VDKFFLKTQTVLLAHINLNRWSGLNIIQCLPLPNGFWRRRWPRVESAGGARRRSPPNGIPRSNLSRRRHRLRRSSRGDAGLFLGRRKSLRYLTACAAQSPVGCARRRPRWPTKTTEQLAAAAAEVKGLCWRRRRPTSACIILTGTIIITSIMLTLTTLIWLNQPLSKSNECNDFCNLNDLCSDL